MNIGLHGSNLKTMSGKEKRRNILNPRPGSKGWGFTGTRPGTMLHTPIAYAGMEK